MLTFNFVRHYTFVDSQHPPVSGVNDYLFIVNKGKYLDTEFIYRKNYLWALYFYIYVETNKSGTLVPETH